MTGGFEEDVVAYDDELLAAPSYGSVEVAEEDVPQGDGGFSDADRMVRVWLEDGRLVRNRLSPVWHSRLGRGDNLGNHYREALLLALLNRAARARDGAADAATEDPLARLASVPDEARAEFEAIGPLSEELIDAVLVAQEELTAQLEAAMEADEAPPPTFLGRSGGVTVTVDASGNTVDVAFDPAWLDDAGVGAITGHVQAAADRAHASYTPIPEDTRVSGLLARQRLLSTVLTAIMNPRSS